MPFASFCNNTFAVIRAILSSRAYPRHGNQMARMRTVSASKELRRTMVIAGTADRYRSHIIIGLDLLLILFDAFTYFNSGSHSIYRGRGSALIHQVSG